MPFERKILSSMWRCSIELCYYTLLIFFWNVNNKVCCTPRGVLNDYTGRVCTLSSPSFREVVYIHLDPLFRKKIISNKKINIPKNKGEYVPNQSGSKKGYFFLQSEEWAFAWSNIELIVSTFICQQHSHVMRLCGCAHISICTGASIL